MAPLPRRMNPVPRQPLRLIRLFRHYPRLQLLPIISRLAVRARWRRCLPGLLRSVRVKGERDLLGMDTPILLRGNRIVTLCSVLPLLIRKNDGAVV